jgi:phospholipid/cholesterol/gamma-HCH transport system permease protein
MDVVTALPRWIGAVVLDLYGDLRGLPGLFVDSFRILYTRKPRWEQWVEQMYAMGNLSVTTIVFSISFTGIVLISEYSFHMRMVLEDDALVPAFSTIMIIREIGPAITALLLVSKVGAAITAEVGTMKVTEQIEALRLLSIDPVEFLTVPRLVASTLATFCLCIMSIAICLLSGVLVSVYSLHFEPGEVLNSLFTFVRFQDFYATSVKALVFGATIPVVCCHYGFKATAGAEGVGRATTNSVVTSAILIIIQDFIITYIFSRVL